MSYNSLNQPFGRLFRGIRNAHKQFYARTVMVKDNDPNEAIRLLNRLMGQEELIDIYRRTRRFEKPYKQRQRVSIQICKSIYNEDMDRKIAFISRKHRADPLPGQY